MKRVVDAVDIASSVIHDLVGFAQNISDVSASGIVHYRELATRALGHVESLERERSELRAQIERIEQTSAARISELEAKVELQKKELEKLRSIVWPSRRV